MGTIKVRVATERWFHGNFNRNSSQTPSKGRDTKLRNFRDGGATGPFNFEKCTRGNTGLRAVPTEIIKLKIIPGSRLVGREK